MFLTEHITRNTWILCLLLIGFGLYYMFSGLLPLGVLAALGFYIIATGQDIIRPQPLEVGLLTIWNRRLPVIIREGNQMLPKAFPFLVNFIRIEVARVIVPTYSFSVVARSKKTGDDGTEGFQVAGQLSVDVSFVFQPDYRAGDAGKRMMQFLISGKAEGVTTQLKQIIERYARDTSLSHSWSEFISLKAAFGASLILHVADTVFHALPREADGTVSDSALKMSDEDYLRGPVIRKDPIDYLAEVDSTSGEYANRVKDIDQFLRVALRNGGGDSFDLGVIIQRMNVENISATGKLADNVDDSAVEDVQRVSEGKDFDTELMLAGKYLDAAKGRGEEMTFQEALERVRINRGRAQEVIVRSSGNPLMDAAALVSGVQNQNQNRS